MRKKSHISLAGQIMDSLELGDVFDYKLPFYVGSIWPDCRPSFVTTPHKFDVTFDDIKKQLSQFVANYNPERGMDVRHCAKLGVIIHYIADYFTFPHNDHYPGNVKDHCYYEGDLKNQMKAFLETQEAAQVKEQVVSYGSVEELTSYIRSIHNSYTKVLHTVQEDIRYIVHVCTTVVKSILEMVSRAFYPAAVKIQYV